MSKYLGDPSIMEPVTVANEGYVRLSEDIREGLLSVYRESPESLEDMVIPVIHFNYYASPPKRPQNLIPAEFAVARFSLEKGFEHIEGSLIDPGDCGPGTLAEVLERCRDILYVPKPPYTLKQGLAYSVGEDRYKEIVRVIKNNVFYKRIYEWNPVFTLSEHIPVVTGCLKWLSEKCDDHLEIGVFPLEILICELFRLIRIRKSIGSMALHWNTDAFESNSEVQNIFSLETPATVKLRLNNTYWNTRLKLGCHWHQRETKNDGLGICSTLLVKKWSNLIIHKGLQLMDREFESKIKDMRGPDIYPRVWTMQDAVGIEARQRLGVFGDISKERYDALEDGFIFSNFITELERRFPNGFTKQPKDIIWPVDQSIEIDLNYCKNATFRVVDPDPEGRAQRLRLKIRRDAEKSQKETEDLWQHKIKIEPTKPEA